MIARLDVGLELGKSVQVIVIADSTTWWNVFVIGRRLHCRKHLKQSGTSVSAAEDTRLGDLAIKLNGQDESSYSSYALV